MRMGIGGARRAIVPLIVALAAGACGSGTPVAQGPVRGGTFKIAAAGDVDSLDPGRTATSFGSLLLRVLARTLVAYPAVDGEKGNSVTIDLASEAPAISPDGKRYVFKLRGDVKYQPEVASGRAIESRDIRYAIERAFYPSVANRYAAQYFRDVFVGDETFLAAPGPSVHIAGIDVSDPLRITFDLKRPLGDFLSRLALPMTAPIPEEDAQPYDTKPVSDYNANAPSTGPYQIERDGSAVTGYKPGERITLVRNPNWDAKTDPIRKAYPEKIEVTEGLDEATRTIDRVLAGEFDYAADTTISADRASEILNDAKVKTQLFFNTSNCMRFVALNTTIPPFDQLKVREAFATALDRAGLVAARGGPRAGDRAGHVLMPGLPGFLEAGGRPFDPRPADVSGNAVRAQEMMKEAGYQTGKYDPEGKQKPVLMVGINADFHRAVTDIVAKALDTIGVRYDRQEYKASDAFGQYVSVPSKKVAVAPNAAWCWLYPDGATVIPPLFDGRRITPAGNSNYSMLNDANVNGLIDQATAARGTRRAELWAQADKAIVALTPVVPWLWERTPTLISKRVVNYRFLLATTSIDLAVVAIKPTGA